jgi:hypothetical protein
MSDVTRLHEAVRRGEEGGSTSKERAQCRKSCRLRVPELPDFLRAFEAARDRRKGHPLRRLDTAGDTSFAVRSERAARVSGRRVEGARHEAHGGLSQAPHSVRGDGSDRLACHSFAKA